MGLISKFRKVGKVPLEKEVANHLRVLLNTKRSFGAWQKGFGIDNYAHYHSKEETVKAIIKDIKFNIENFEKRVLLLEIAESKDMSLFHYRFVIKCKIGSRFHSFYIGFKTAKDLVEVEFQS